MNRVRLNPPTSLHQPISGSISRLAELRYPLINAGGKQRTILTQHYGAANSLDDKISRSRGFDWDFQAASPATHAIRYDHLGMGNPVLVEYKDAALQLNRYTDPTYNGSGANPGEYAGMDQYGRLVRQVWASWTDTTPTWNPSTKPAVIDVAYHYDVNSDITQRYDARQGTSLADQGDAYAYDGLHRLTGATRGKPVSGWTADGTRAEDWDLDVFGNWNTYDNSIGSDLVEETRNHNQANELIENARSINSGTAVDLDSTYDDAGNLRTRMVDAEVRWVYTWDAWNRLVAVDIEEFKAGDWYSLAPRLESSYYGLNQRAWSRLDAGAAGYTNNGVPTNVLDRMELFYYDASWRLLERRTDETWNGTSFVHDSTSQWVWGQRYIDELVAGITDGDANDEFEDRFYAMTDRNFSVIGLSQSAGSSGERIRYDAYGHARAMPLGDADHSGAVDLDDQNILLSNFGADIGDTGSPLYRVEADFDSNGVIDLDDFNTVITNFGDSIERGRLSASGNIVGYAGYLFEPATGMYVVRHRWYSAENGRWLSRDPIGYSGGYHVYNINHSSPLANTDPDGLVPMRLEPPFDYDQQLPEEPPTAPPAPSMTPEERLAHEARKKLMRDRLHGCGIRIRREIKPQDGVNVGHEWIEFDEYDVTSDRLWLRAIGFYPAGWYRGSDPNAPRGKPDRSGPVTIWPQNDPNAHVGKPRGPGIHDWPARVVWRGGTLKHGNGTGTPCEKATCDQIRNCLSSFVPSEPWKLFTNDCRTGGVEPALKQCCLTRGPTEPLQ